MLAQQMMQGAQRPGQEIPIQLLRPADQGMPFSARPPLSWMGGSASSGDRQMRALIGQATPAGLPTSAVATERLAIEAAPIASAGGVPLALEDGARATSSEATEVASAPEVNTAQPQRMKAATAKALKAPANIKDVVAAIAAARGEVKADRASKPKAGRPSWLPQFLMLLITP